MKVLNAYIALMRLNRPVGIYLVLWPALWALWLASAGLPNLYLLLVFTLGAILMRSAGCVINDYADRHFDGHVARTCCRPLATGEISPKAALGLFAALCALAFGLVLTLNTLTIALSFGALFLAALYPFTKRHTHWPQAFLGAAFAWAVPMAFAAVLNSVPLSAWPLFFATLLWSLIYDTAYAMGDKADDLKIGVKSTAILFGDHWLIWLGFFQLLMLGCLVWTGWLFGLHAPYYLSLLAVALWFVWDLIRLNNAHSDQASTAFKVFVQNHWIGVLVLVGIAVDYAII